MADQLPLDLAQDPPRRRRTATLRAAHLQGQPVTVDEALALEKRANGQDKRVLAVFQTCARGRALTPSQVRAYLCNETDPPAPLLTSIRRALTNLTKRGLLVHHKADRRPGPHGSKESTWGLAG